MNLALKPKENSRLKQEIIITLTMLVVVIMCGCAFWKLFELVIIAVQKLGG